MVTCNSGGYGVNAATQQYCTADDPNICFSIAVPSSSANAGSGNIYFQISAPTTYQWVALGTGSRMTGSNIFLVYQDGSGNLTVSPRLGTQYVEPQLDTSSTAAKLTLLAGSGVQDGKMIANIRCANCETWSGGSMSLTSSANWISAWKRGSSLSTTAKDASISKHDSTDRFSLDMSTASISSDSNPFLRDSTAGSGSGSGTGAGSGTGSGSGSGSGSNTGSGFTQEEGSLISAKVLVAHGIIMALVMAILYPLGSLLMPLLGNWKVHAAWQTVSFILMWVGFGIGVKCALDRESLFKQAHTILGTVVVCLMFIQPILGFVHHRHFVAHQSRGMVSYAHIWYGRALLVLGVVNGGLGLQLSDERDSLKIAYSVIAAIVFFLYFAAKLWSTFQKKQRGIPKQVNSPRSRSSVDHPRRPYQEGKRRDAAASSRQLESVDATLHSPELRDTNTALLSTIQGARKAVASVSRLAQTQMRTFIAPTVTRRADFVQELYLKELKAYKPAPIKDSDAAGQVATFNLPKTPKSPEETDLASSLKEYESMAVEVEGQAAADAGQPAAVVEDWLVEEEEDDAHHGH
ncbi:CBD9-like protein [Rhypophila decipiens]|uniref:CBD9-like protein n=1 Tax=Rhypophila decipiens TaxID=261697 RepID=A0AAN6YE77_9PEZI|nr:CBD9-like protein [Rhypophila decipiens]